MSSKNFKVKEGLDVNGTVTAPSILTPVIEVPVPLSFVPTAALCMFGDSTGPMTFSAFTALGSEYLNLPIGTVITIPDGLTYASGTPISGSGTYTILSATSQEYGVDYALQMGTGAGFGGNTYGGGYVDFDPTSLTILFSVTTGSAGTAGQVLQSTGTGLEWADPASGLPALGSTTTANLGTLLNVSVGYNYDQASNATQVVLTPSGTIDDAAITAFNTTVPGTTNFTISYNNGANSTTFLKIGAAENVGGMQITIPVQYVSGDVMAGATDPNITYGTSSAGKFLTNNGTSASWGTVREVPSLDGTTTIGLHTIINGGTSVSYSYDQQSFPTTVSVTPMSGINSNALAEFNSLVQGTTEFTISFDNSGSPASTTFIKTGAAMDPNGAGTIEIPVQYVSGNTMASTTDPSITYVTSNSGKFLTNDGTTSSWATLPAGLPSLGSTTTANLGIMLNLAVGYNYDQMSNATQVVLTPYGTIDDTALAAFNTSIPGGTNFTLSYNNGANSTTFTKTGAAENVGGMQITIPVQYVSGDVMAGATDPTITYGTSSAGKFLTNDGSTASWESIPAIPSYNGGPTDVELSEFFNVGISGIIYDINNNPYAVSLTLSGASDQSGIDAFNQLDEFTLSYSDAGTTYSTTFVRVAALQDMGTGTLNLPVQYVQGDQFLNTFNPVTIVYDVPSQAGKFLTNNGTDLSWGSAGGGMTLLTSYSSNPQYSVGFDVSQAYKKLVVYVSDISSLNPTYLSIGAADNGNGLLFNTNSYSISLNNYNGNYTASNAFMFTIHNYSDPNIYSKLFEASSAYQSDDGSGMGTYTMNQESISGFIQGGIVTSLQFDFMSSADYANITIYGSN